MISPWGTAKTVADAKQSIIKWNVHLMISLWGMAKTVAYAKQNIIKWKRHLAISFRGTVFTITCARQKIIKWKSDLAVLIWGIVLICMRVEQNREVEGWGLRWQCCCKVHTYTHMRPCPLITNESAELVVARLLLGACAHAQSCDFFLFWRFAPFAGGISKKSRKSVSFLAWEDTKSENHVNVLMVLG